MRTKRELYQEAMRTVALRRQAARANAEDARAEAEAAIPALRHAEEEVRVRGVRCALAGASGGDRTAAAAALTKAKQELAALLASSGRPADALEPHFTCKKIGAGNIDHVHVLRQHDARNGKGRMGLAKARIAEKHQTFAAAVEFFCVGTQFFQKSPHVRPDRNGL